MHRLVRNQGFASFVWFLVVIGGVLAFGISQDYHPDQRIELLQGDTYVQHVTIQNDLPVALPARFTVTGKYASLNGATEQVLSIPGSTTAGTYVSGSNWVIDAN